MITSHHARKFLDPQEIELNEGTSHMKQKEEDFL